MKKIGKILGIVLLSLVLIIGIVLSILPNYIAKYASDNGKDLSSRQISIENIDINYFSGNFLVEEFLMLEENEQDTFIYFQSLNLNLDLLDCISEQYHVESLLVDKLKCAVIMDGEKFNFDGLVNHFASDTTTAEIEEAEDTAAIFYAIDQLELKNSSIYFEDKVIGSQIQLQEIQITTPKGIYSDEPLIEASTSLKFKSGGNLKAEIDYHLEKETYDFELVTEKLQLNVVQPYVEDFMYLGLFEGLLGLDLKIGGNLKNETDVDISGPISLTDVKVTDTNQVEVTSISYFEIEIDSINPAKDIYEVDHIQLDTAFARFELYKEGDNISNMLIGTDSLGIDSTHSIEEEYYSNVFVMLGAYIHDALEGIKASNFNIDTLQLKGLQFYYADHTLVQDFDYWVTETNLDAYGLKSSADSLTAKVSSLLNHQGILNGNATFYPQKPKDVRIDVIVDKFAMKDLSSYFHHYVAFPVLKGIYRMQCNLEIKDSQLKSSNDLELQSFALGKKQKHEQMMVNMPLKLAVSMLKDRNGNIPLNIPVEGDLADPKYKVWKTVGKIFSELIVKAATAPYKLIAGSSDEESAKYIVYKHPLDTLNPNQYKRLDKLAEVLLDKPDLAVLLHANYQLQSQAENLALIYAKADFLKLNREQGVSLELMKRVDLLANTDSSFQVFLNKKVKAENREWSEGQKAFARYDAEKINADTKQKINNQVGAIFDYLKSKGVEEKNLPQLVKGEEVLYENTSSKNIQVQILFDVLESGGEE